MTALQSVYMVEGRPTVSAEAMRGMVLAAGHDLEVVEMTGARCVVRGRRRFSSTWTTVGWTLDMARAAGLLGKSNWKSYPRAMLLARATTDLCRAVFPDVIKGFRSSEETTDMDPATDVPQLDGPAAAPEPRKRVSRRKPPEPVGPPPAAEEPPVEPPAPPVESEETDPPAEPPVEPETPPREPRGDMVGPVSAAQVKMIHASFARLGFKGDDERDARLRVLSVLLTRPIENTGGLSKREAHMVIETLGKIPNRPTLDQLVSDLEAEQTPEGGEDQ